MKYRWGFLDENDAFSECFPKVDDGTAIDFAPESGEVFYRAKLNGNLSFRYEFDAILAEGYNYEHKIVLQWYDSDNDEWKEVWKGRFVLTDCEIDYDTKTITVTPSTLDRYTKILDNLDKDYNIVKLAPAMRPVNILIRPCLQVYLCGSDKISCYVGGNYWEATCDSITSPEDVEGNGLQHEDYAYAALIKWKGGDLAGQTVIYCANQAQTTGYMYGWAFSGGDGYQVSIRYEFERATGHNGGTFKYYLENTLLFTAYIEEPGDLAEITINDTANVDEATAEMLDLRSRTLVQTDYPTGMHTIDGVSMIINNIPSDDFAGTNANYNKRIRCYTADLLVTADVVDEPTVWGQNIDGKYFVKPSDPPGFHYMPVGQSNWRLVSCWWKLYVDDGKIPLEVINNHFSTVREIADAYDYRQTIFRLMEKAGENPQYIISGCLGGSNDYVGTRTDLIITPRSNIISSYYDTPAQNAPISLAKIFSMLKQAFKAYWHVDSNGNLHIEHISYYDNGLNYTDSPQLLVDLESEIHTNTKNNKVFGQNKVKFDKQDMPEQYTFGWADAVTRPFIGYPINCLDAYVQKGTKDEKVIGDFDSDVDFVLSSPNDVSKEGFFLFALPAIEGGGYSPTLKIDKVTITDEIGDTYEVTIQNGDAAFVKIHETWWRYSLPCEHVNINNENTTAKTTGRFKLQSVEFADTIMAEILKDVDNCNKVLRTQQGDGHIKSISINLNSLVAKGDLLFNFVGRWYYLKGLALGNSFTAIINGESITIDVSANKYSYRYKEPIATLKFAAADVVSVEFGDCDNLDNLTSCDEMFDGCEELLAVDFGNKTFGAVTSANNMFRGCIALTTLICPDSSKWKADLDLSDCPSLTTESFYDLIKFLYYYESGVHTITPNSTMWNALDGDTQTDLIAKATERGWTINMPAAYSITGQSAGNTVYATINGSPVEIPVTAGQWQYDYNAAITSISFENDADLTSVDFSLSDGLAGVTSLNDAFKNCAGLTSVDFTGCDLSNVASASDAFANCINLYELIIPSGTWKPDIDLSAGVMPKAEMLNVITGLYLYTTGTHTITFNSTIWDAMSVADQQQVYNAADAKGWTTNAVAVTYVIRGTSSNVNGTETFNIQFIDDITHIPNTESITCNVDANGKFEYQYAGKKIYRLFETFYNNTTITHLEFTEELSEIMAMDANTGRTTFPYSLVNISFPNATFDSCQSIDNAFFLCAAIQEINMPNAHFNTLTSAYSAFNLTNTNDISIILPNDAFPNLTNARQMFANVKGNLTLNQTFANVLQADYMFINKNGNINLPNATFASATTLREMFRGSALSEINLPSATFASVTTITNIFQNATNLRKVKFPSATFAALQDASGFFNNVSGINEIDLSSATFANVTNASLMFANLAITSLSLPEATFANLTSGDRMFTINTQFVPTPAFATLSMPKATMPKVSNTTRMFDLNSLVNVSVPNTNSAFVASVNMAYSALSYQSMLNAANWVSDRNNLSALTITFKSTAWNAITAAEQATIDGILSGKNWNRAIA